MKRDFIDTPEYGDFVSMKNSGILLGKKLFTVTFGCQQNEADTEKIRGMLHGLGCVDAKSAQEADIIIMNTCAIREHAELKALSMLGRFKELKRKNESLVIGVVGCMAAEPKRQTMLKCDFHYVDFTLEPSLLYKLPSLVQRSLSGGGRSFVIGQDDGSVTEGLPISRSSGFRAWVSIMYGCNNFCTYCIVPYVRGRERSRESGDVLSECRELVSSGIKEITLLGQNVNSYRSDMDFAELISEIAKIDGDFIIRFMTSHPKDVSPRLIEAMKRYEGKIAPCFHLPLQSGSNKILKAMNRTYTREKYLDTVRALREAVPDIALSTDVIVGFPGEDDADFEETMEILREVRFDSVFAFIYSKREGTAASKMTRSVSREDADGRMSVLLREQAEISLEKNLPLVGKTVRVLVEGEAKKGERGTYTARTPSGKLVHFLSEANCTGEFKNVKIERAGAFELFGSEIK